MIVDRKELDKCDSTWLSTERAFFMPSEAETDALMMQS
jgi:hypothetical protein